MHECLIIRDGKIYIEEYHLSDSSINVFDRSASRLNKKDYIYLGAGIMYRIDGVYQICNLQPIEHFWKLKPTTK